jgi:hypothetical protein
MRASELLLNVELFFSGAGVICFLITIIKNMDKSRISNAVLQKLFHPLWPIVEIQRRPALMCGSADRPWFMHLSQTGGIFSLFISVIDTLPLWRVQSRSASGRAECCLNPEPLKSPPAFPITSILYWLKMDVLTF